MTIASKLKWLLIISGSAILSFMIVQTPFISSLDEILYEPVIAFDAAGKTHSKDVALILINEESLKPYSQRSPVPRGLLNKMILELTDKGARQIGLFYLLGDLESSPEEFQLKKRILESPIPIHFLGKVQREGFSTGHARLSLTSAGIVRKAYLDKGDSSPSFTGRFLQGFSDTQSGGSIKNRDGIRVRYYHSSSPESGYFPVYFPNEIKAVPARFFKDKILLIGSDSSLASGKITAMRFLGRQRIPEVEIQAHLLETRLKGEQIQEFGSLTLFLIAILSSIAGWMLLGANPSLKRLVIIVTLSSLILFLINALLLEAGNWYGSFIIPWLSLCFALAGRFQIFHRKRQHRFLKIEKELQEKESTLRILLQKVEEVSRQGVTALEGERKRLSREIHDGLGQNLTSLNLQLHTLQKSIDPSESDLVRKTDHIISNVQSAFESMKSVVANLVPRELEELGLEEALERLMEKGIPDKSIRIDFLPSPQPLDLGEDISLTLYRTAQELLNNCAKHSGATKVRCKLYIKEAHIILSFTDNGSGFSKKDRQKQDSFGIRGLTERAELLKGEFRLRGLSGIGTAAKLSLPLSK